MKRILVLLGVLALASCARIEEKDPKVVAQERATARVQLAVEYYRLHNYLEARRSVMMALEFDPKYVPAFNTLAMISMELRDDDAARENFRRALLLAPNDSEVLHNYGWFLCERGDPRNGLIQLQNAVRNPLYANQDRSLTAAGLCAKKSGDNGAARDFFERALKYHPGNTEAKFNLADILLQTNYIVEARLQISELMKMMDPPSAELLWMAVRVERKIANREGELRYANELRKRYPESLEASRLMAGQ